MTFIDKFNSIKKKTENLETSSLPHDLAMQVNLTDADCGGTFYIANIGGIFAVEPYDYRDRTVMLTVSSKEFVKILNGKLDATDAYFRGLLEIDGNIEHAQAIANLVKAAPAEKKTSAKKPATKKTAEKKAPAKKTAAKNATKK